MLRGRCGVIVDGSVLLALPLARPYKRPILPRLNFFLNNVFIKAVRLYLYI
jgi:hypothetical protein